MKMPVWWGWPAEVVGRLGQQRLPDELEALRAWLPGGRVDQKRLDALAMLRVPW